MGRGPVDAWQFRLSAAPAKDALPVGRFWLEAGPGLAHVEVQDSAGRPAGVLLGYVIDLARRRVAGAAWQAPVPLTEDVDRFARAVLWSLGGNFLWIFAADGVSRIYPDSSVQLPCVWDASARVAASTAHAMFDDAEYGARFDKDLYDAMGVDGEGWLTAGLTAHTGVQRLLPCHYLDLDGWTARRFWSVAEVTEAADPRAAVGRLGDLVRAQMEAILQTPAVLGVGLTAGRETRALLSCARPFVERIEAITVVGTDRHLTDSVIARRIARTFDIRHRQLQRTTATRGQRDLFVRRVGHCYADSNAWFHPSVWPIAGTHVMVGGTGGEVGRGFFWRASDQDGTRLTPQVLIARLGLPPVPALVAAVTAWLDGLPPMNAFQLLDQAYLDLRMGPWHGVQFCGNPTIVRVAPLLTYPGVEILLSLPRDWKRESRFVEEIIRANWPELLRIPFNSLGWFQDRVVLAQKLAKDPSLLWKKLRKLRG